MSEERSEIWELRRVLTKFLGSTLTQAGTDALADAILKEGFHLANRNLADLVAAGTIVISDQEDLYKAKYWLKNHGFEDLT